MGNPLTCETAAAPSSTLCTRRRAADPASFLKHNLQCTQSLVRHRVYNIMYHVATHTQSCCLQWYNASKGAQKKQVPMSKNPMKNEKPAGSRIVETVQKRLRSWQQNSRDGSGTAGRMLLKNGVLYQISVCGICIYLCQYKSTYTCSRYIVTCRDVLILLELGVRKNWAGVRCLSERRVFHRTVKSGKRRTDPLQHFDVHG